MIDRLHSRARHAVLRAATLGTTALLGAALLATWQAPAATGWNQSSAEGTVWQLTNGARANNGLRVLQGHSTLVGLARWRSKDQVERNYFDHTVLGTGYQVYHWYDTNGLAYRYGGENIGWNNGMSDADSPVKIHEGFMASPGHRANILNGDWTHGGIGAFAADNVNFLGKIRSPRFYTELFMQALSASAPPPTTSAPPPPSGGGGSTATVSRTTSSAAAAVSAPTPERVAMAAPVRPTASAPFDGAAPAATRQDPWSSHRVRALPTEAAWPRGDATWTSGAGSLRVAAAAAGDAGFVRAFLAGVMGSSLD